MATARDAGRTGTSRHGQSGYGAIKEGAPASQRDHEPTDASVTIQHCAIARGRHYNEQRRWRMRYLAVALVSSLLAANVRGAPAPVYFDVVSGSAPHDVAAAPGPNAPVYYTAQRTGRLGILDPATRKVEEVDLGTGSAP